MESLPYLFETYGFRSLWLETLRLPSADNFLRRQIIIGVVAQAALMNLGVLLWWSAGPGLHGMVGDIWRCYNAICFVFISPVTIWECLNEDFKEFGESVCEPDFVFEPKPTLSDRREYIRSSLQKMFKSWSDTQAITGIALLLAALLQGSNLSLYHTAIVLDLISISSDGQAIMLFYAYNKEPRQVGASVLTTERGVWPRLASSLWFLILYFVYVAKAYVRYQNLDECFLSSKPRTGNYGIWGISTAIMVLLVYLPNFCPEKIKTSLGEAAMSATKRQFMRLYSKPQGRQEDLEHHSTYFKWLEKYLLASRHSIRLILGLFVWTITRLLRWLYVRELSFPLGTWIYFTWNTIDLWLLKNTNSVLLIDTGSEEWNFAAFGQIVPIVMVASFLYPIFDLTEGMSRQNISIRSITDNL